MQFVILKLLNIDYHQMVKEAKENKCSSTGFLEEMEYVPSAGPEVKDKEEEKAEESDEETKTRPKRSSAQND